MDMMCEVLVSPLRRKKVVENSRTMESVEMVMGVGMDRREVGVQTRER